MVNRTMPVVAFAALVTCVAQAQCPPDLALLSSTIINQPQRVKAAHLDGDGVIDLVAANNSHQLFILRAGPGTYTTTSLAVGTLGEAAKHMVIVDVNGDGNQDVVAVLSTTGNQVRTFFGSGDGAFTNGPTANHMVSSTPTGIAHADFNADGRLDLVISFTGGQLVLCQGDGAGGFTRTGLATASGATGGLALSDVNGDGRPDAIASVGSAQVSIWPTTATGFGPPTYLPVTAFPSDVAGADLNADGRGDFAVACQGASGDGFISVSLNLAGGWSTTAYPADYNCESLAAADFDGDGDTDLAGPSNFGGANGVRLLANAGNGVFTSAGSFPLPTNAGIRGCAASDLNSDGRVDLALASSNASRVYGMLNGGAYLVTVTQQATPGQSLYQAGQTATISAAATSAGTLTFQWRKNSVNITDDARISGATTSTLIITSASSTDTASYDLVIQSACNGQPFDTRTTAAAILAVTGSTPGCGSADFDGDGDLGTDADIEAFFRVLAGGSC